jgi:ABC-type phosphate transport system substrate-binding protein
MRQIVVSVLAVVVLVLGLSRMTEAQRGNYKVIVHPDNPATAVSRDFVRSAFLKKASQWRGGETLRPIDLSRSFPIRDRFTTEILNKTPSQLKNYWNQRIFSGKGVPPPEVETAADMIAYVVNEPGAIGYIPSHVDPGDAKVVEVD